jgi:hypothetical protein
MQHGGIVSETKMERHIGHARPATLTFNELSATSKPGNISLLTLSCRRIRGIIPCGRFILGGQKSSSSV